MSALVRVAFPVEGDQLSGHFGHAPEFLLVDVQEGKEVSRQTHPSPEHQPGLIPQWLRGFEVDLVVAGGIGARAAQLFEEAGIDLISGVSGPVEDVLLSYLRGQLRSTGALWSSHGHDHGEGHGSCGNGCSH